MALERDTINASLRFKSDTLDPKRITALLGIEPCLSYRKGQHYTSGRRRRRVAGLTGLWLKRTDALCHSINLQSHVDLLMSYLQAPEIIAEYIEKYTIEMSVWIVWSGTKDSIVPTLDENFEGLVRRAGGQLWFETFVDVDEF